MNEREDYLDRLLQGVGDGPEGEIQRTEDRFFGSDSTDDYEDDFLKAFEKSMSESKEKSNQNSDFVSDMNLDMDSDLDMDMDFNMDDIDNIVSNVKNGTLDDLDEYGNLDDGKDLSIEESLKNDTEEDTELDGIQSDFNMDPDDEDYMVNTMDQTDETEYEPGESGKNLMDMLSDMDDNIGLDDDIELNDDIGLDEFDEMQEEEKRLNEEFLEEDDLDAMAKELAMEIDELGLGSDEEHQEPLPDEPEEQESEEEGKKGKKGKKKKDKDKENRPGFFKRFTMALFGEEIVEAGSIPELGDMENISDENLDILKELDGEKDTDKEKENEKAKKAQKKKEKAEKKEQKQKEKQAKPKKEKKPKPPKTVVKTKPLPKKPVFMIMLVGVSLVVLINLLSTQSGYVSSITAAEKYYAQGDYVSAYTVLPQKKDVKEVDLELYEKARVTAYLQQMIISYNMYQSREMHAEALSALIRGVGRYDKNARDAALAGSAVEYDKMLTKIKKALKNNYNMTLDEARELYSIREKEDYTYAVYDVIDELGLGETETQ